MESTLSNERDRGSCLVDIRWRRHVDERDEIHTILWSKPVIPRQDLERDQVPRRCDANPKIRKDFQRLGFGDYFRLDTGGGKERVENDASLALIGQRQAGGRQTSRRLLSTMACTR